MKPLISPQKLRIAMAEPTTVVFDCRFSLADPDEGARAFAAGHVPSATYAHLNRDLSSPVIPGVTGRHPLPQPAAFAEFLARSGVTSQSRVIAYDEGNGAFAARLWWLCRYVGHDAVQVLDGGWAAWLESGGVSTTETTTRARGSVEIQLRPYLVASVTEVTKLQSDPSARLFDARGADRFRGENETIDPVAGHIPGASSLPFVDNLKDGKFRSLADLSERFERALGGTAPVQAVVYCGSGVTACHNLLAAEAAGISGMRLYPGSFSEWITDPSRPVATGE